VGLLLLLQAVFFSSTPQVSVFAAGSHGLSSITSCGFDPFPMTSEFDFGNRGPFLLVPSRSTALQQELDSYPTPFPSPNIASDLFRSDCTYARYPDFQNQKWIHPSESRHFFGKWKRSLVISTINCLRPPFPYLVTGVMKGWIWETFGEANFMTHPCGIDFPFYLRRCCENIYQVLDERFKCKKRSYGQLCPTVLVTGTPGIGKTIFGILLSRMVRHTKSTLSSLGENMDITRTYVLLSGMVKHFISHLAQPRR
jgi:hypothetical protein